MIYFIDGSKSQHTNPDILKTFAKYGGNDPSEKQFYEKIVYHDPKNGVYGGGELTQKSSHSFFKDDVVSAQKPCSMWVLENVFFDIDNEDIHKDLKRFQWHCRNFYRALYGQLISFSVNTGLKFIFVYADIEEYKDMLHFGAWHWNVEVKFPDEMVLSRLPMAAWIQGEFS